MSFEVELKNKIDTLPYQSKERSVFKMLLGEIQQKSSLANVTDDFCLSLVKKSIKGNEETLGYLKADDERRKDYEEEVAILKTLLPSYLSKEQILDYVNNNNLSEQIVNAKNDGAAMGALMGSLKKNKQPVEGDVVKEVVAALRSNG